MMNYIFFDVVVLSWIDFAYFFLRTKHHPYYGDDGSLSFSLYLLCGGDIIGTCNYLISKISLCATLHLIACMNGERLLCWVSPPQHQHFSDNTSSSNDNGVEGEQWQWLLLISIVALRFPFLKVCDHRADVGRLESSQKISHHLAISHSLSP